MALEFGFELVVQGRPDLEFDLAQLTKEMRLEGSVDDIAIELEVMGSGSALTIRTATYRWFADSLRARKKFTYEKVVRHIAQRDERLSAWLSYTSAAYAWSKVTEPFDTRAAYLLEQLKQSFGAPYAETKESLRSLYRSARLVSDNAEDNAAIADAEGLAHEAVKFAVAAALYSVLPKDSRHYVSNSTNMARIKSEASVMWSDGIANVDGYYDSEDRYIPQLLKSAFADSLLGYPVQTKA